MNKLFSFLFLASTSLMYAQSPQSFSYQSVVRDANNDLVTNQAIGVQISILQDSTSATAVYVERHDVTSNDNGLITLRVGAGTVVSGTFSSIDWGSASHYIKSELDVTGGTSYAISGTSQMLSVPYALYAESAGNQSDDQTLSLSGDTLSIVDGNSVVLPSSSSTGLEQVTEGGNTGRRLAGVDTANYGNIGDYALDLSYSPSPSSTLGATGSYSTAMGLGATASGAVSTAMGLQTNASGNYSTAMGVQTTATGSYSTAMGYQTIASGDVSSTMGYQTTAPSGFETSIGQYNNDYTPNSTTGWDNADRLFSVGNGTSISARSNALTIYKDGKMNINDAYDMPLADGTAGQVLTTDGAGVTSWAAITDNQTLSLSGDTLSIAAGNSVVLPSSSSTGLEQVTEGGNIGRRLAGADPNNYGNIGADAVDLSFSNSSSNTRGATGDYSTAMGYNTTAFGNYSTAMGWSTTASGYNSTAMGNTTTASGWFSTATGYNTNASGDYSTATGYNTNAFGNYSTATGYNTNASAVYSTAMGRSTTASGGQATSMGFSTTASGAASTAMGDNTTASGFRSTAMGVQTTASGYASTAMGNAVNATGIGELYNSGNVKGLSFTSTSDRRVKKNIQDFSGALEKVLQLNARTYYYNVEEYPRFEAEKDKPQIGFIAQEVEQVLPEMVLTDGDEVGLKGVRYGQLTPVLVEAIKEMKADYENKIETQERKIETQEVKIETQEQRIEKLERMVEQLLNAKGE